MKEERVQDILKRLEQNPELPLMMLIDHEAVEAIGQVRRTYPNAHLVMLHGIRYIAITDAALECILDRLERERTQFVRTLEHYDRDIAGVKALMGTGTKVYWSQNCIVPAPALKNEQ